MKQIRQRWRMWRYRVWERRTANGLRADRFDVS
jgi:hypothetical protein